MRPETHHPAPGPGSADPAGRCPRCGARLVPGIGWCGQCHHRTGEEPVRQVAGPGPEEPVRQVSGPGPEEPVRAPERILTGGGIPEEALAGLLRRLQETSEPVLPRAALALTGRLQQAAVAILGGLGLTVLLIGVAELAARLF